VVHSISWELIRPRGAFFVKSRDITNNKRDYQAI